MPGAAYTVAELASMLGATEVSGEASFDGVSTDTRSIARGNLFVALRGERFDGNDYLDDAFDAGAAAAIANQHGPGPTVVVDDTQRALQQFAAAHRRRCNATIIAITGSSGKTTSKNMIAAVLASRYTVVATQGNLNNEIGCPLSLLAIGPDTEYAVIEMGANHAGEIARLCEIAAPDESGIVNISEAHLEGFGGIEGVARAKSEIVSGLRDDGVFYLNVDDERCMSAAESFSGRVVTFGTNAGMTPDVLLRSCARAADGGLTMDIEPIGEITLPLLVPALATNVLLAVAVGLQHGIEAFEAPLQESARASSRMTVKPVGPWVVLDDSYNANPASVRAAIDALAQYPAPHRYCVLGDMLELGDDAAALHEAAGRYAGEAGIDGLIARGAFAKHMVRGATDAGIAFAQAEQDYEAIAEALIVRAEAGDALLIKGSRGMRMERVLEALEARLRQGAQPEGSA